MSGPFGSSQWMYQSAAGFYPYQIEQSLRFNDNDSAYLSRTPAGAGNRKTWTWSGWVKRGNLSNTQGVFQGFVNTLNLTALRISSGNTISIQQYNDGSFNLVWGTQAVFRDPSAWYHIVASFDSTEASSSNSVKMYVNGNEQSVTFTAFEGSYVQNRDSTVNSVTAHNIGRYVTGNYFDGYLAEVNFIDGTALDPTSFGETKSGIWVPKAYAGAYGTNGFYLSFADSAAIGDDLSGNGNDWTANNLVATDVLLDSPTQNWCVLNPLTNTGGTFTEGNLQYVGPSSSRKILGTTGVSTGKWYWEVAILNAPFASRTSNSQYNTFGFSLASSVNVTTLTGDSEVLTLGDSGYYRNFSGSWTDGGTAIANGDVLACAVDLDAGTFAFKKNNVDIVTGSIDSSADGKVLTPHQGSYDASYGKMFCNFGQDSSFAGNKTRQGNTDDNGVGDFYYAPPSGFLALCTANLPDPVIDPAQDDVPADYFNTVLYTGTGADLPVSVGFQPDLIWTKARSAVDNHLLVDNIRGIGNILISNTTGAESAYAAFDSFDANGFTKNSLESVSGRTYVAWNWLAGNGTASNTDGSITSTVSVNQKAGFSVVSYTGTRTSAGNDTIGHGLGKAPSVVISKARNATGRWVFQHSSLGADDYLELNTTSASADSVSAGAGSLPKPTSSVFYGSYLFGLNVNGENCIAYCFAEVEGYSKFGSYTGNGSTDGPFVYCGFRPAWVMFKRTNSAEGWIVQDATREPINDANRTVLFPNSSDAETTDAFPTDFLSNGFKIRNLGTGNNASGSTYIFAAFSEQPFKFSNAR
jgi:hypothetical protein